MMNSIYLKPGELYFGDQPAEVTTVLGSCVAITMHHPDTRLAAICHALQPTIRKTSVGKDTCLDEAFRYVDSVIPRMVESFRDHGVRPGSIQVKLFGGAAIIGSHQNRDPQLSVGQMNVEAALEIINAGNLNLRVANAGGHFGRKIIFNTRTGIVWMKKIENSIIALDTQLKTGSESLDALNWGVTTSADR